MLILVIFAFIAGLVTILSPCILPILPIVLSGSISGGKRRPYGVVVGFVASFSFFTLFLSSLVRATGVSPDVLRIVGAIVIALFGIALLIPATQVVLEKLVSSFSRFTPKTQNDGFGSGVLIGLSLGLFWAPCVGPILASVITLAATSQVSFAAVAITLAYSLGTAIPMLAIVHSGRQLLQKNPWLTSRTAAIQKGFGVVMIATALALVFNLDRQFQTYILTKFPSYGAGLTQFESNPAVQEQLESISTKRSAPIPRMIEGPVAPDFTGGQQWINSEPLSLQTNLKGKVVLVDFWTYSCINCIRTFPHIKDWWSKYKDQDFVIVGVHTPEFEFEKKLSNVQQAVKDFGLEYPVVQDNDFAIWQAYRNQYWPAHYLIDKNGKIRYTHFGEGKYTETENAIRMFLDEEPLTETVQESRNRQQTPEIYLGYKRADHYSEQLASYFELDTTVNYQLREPLRSDEVGLSGAWKITEESILSDGGKSTSSLSIKFLATNVHLVLESSTGKPVSVEVKLDGQPLPEKYQTPDYKNGKLVVSGARKYDIVDLGADYGRHTVELVIPAGVSAYAFTFGS